MPKGIATKTQASGNTMYTFYTCSCGFEIVVDNIKDIKRAEKLKKMKMRLHLRNCPCKPDYNVDHGGIMPEMNGSYLAGKDAKNVKVHHEGGDVRTLMEHQFPDVCKYKNK